ncbi:hypothetical protein [Nocardioides sp. Soil805]|uniref:hypothetical protein n=1 Tax=Nocardioides sp. Soil805 TaxID=1736416 RepID=UPI0012E376FF|nr:hypothetical protein [Nocardioides sp. Soil805]
MSAARRREWGGAAGPGSPRRYWRRTTVLARSPVQLAAYDGLIALFDVVSRQ